MKNYIFIIEIIVLFENDDLKRLIITIIVYLKMVSKDHKMLVEILL